MTASRIKELEQQLEAARAETQRIKDMCLPGDLQLVESHAALEHQLKTAQSVLKAADARLAQLGDTHTGLERWRIRDVLRLLGQLEKDKQCT